MKDDIHPLPAFLTAALPNPVRQRVLRKAERLFAQGDAVDAIFFVCRGRVKAVRALHNGMQSVMLQATAGEFFAESALAVDAYVCDAVATEDSILWSLPAKDVLAALNAGGDFAKTFALAMAANARRQCSRYERVRLKRARDRVLHLLICEGGPEASFTLTMPLVELAEELALEPETLYRVLRELTDEGLLERSRTHLRLVGANAGD
jgi:CRP/FNR family transcriptional regulator